MDAVYPTRPNQFEITDCTQRLADTLEKTRAAQFYVSIPKAVIVDGRVGICCIRF